MKTILSIPSPKGYDSFVDIFLIKMYTNTPSSVFMALPQVQYSYLRLNSKGKPHAHTRTHSPTSLHSTQPAWHSGGADWGLAFHGGAGWLWGMEQRGSTLWAPCPHSPRTSKHMLTTGGQFDGTIQTLTALRKVRRLGKLAGFSRKRTKI